MIFLLLLIAAPHPAVLSGASQPASAPAITPETRPELYRDTPPERVAPSGASGHAPQSAASFWVAMLIRTVLVLGAVVALAYLVLAKGLGRLMKTGTSGNSRLVTLVERLSLDQKHALYLVEADGRRFLVGTADQSTALVAELGGRGEAK